MSGIKVVIFGESHSPQIGVHIDGIREGTRVDLDFIQSFVDRRRAGNFPWSTARLESDKVEFVSGLNDGIADGSRITAVIRNSNVHSSDYDELKYTPRPSHADYAAYVKDGADGIVSGGGRFSGRLTAAMCIAGAIAMDILNDSGILVGAYVSRIGQVAGRSYADGLVSFDDIMQSRFNPICALSDCTQMIEEIAVARASLDSVGGTVECIVYDLPVGLGDNLFGGLESAISYNVFAIPAVKGLEFGAGFGLSHSKGSKSNDEFMYDGDRVITTTNNNGGINGGISNGMPVTLRVAFKPTPSIGIPQRSVDLNRKENTVIEIKGRHDACIVPRAVPVVESAVALAILDKMYEEGRI